MADVADVPFDRHLRCDHRTRAQAGQRSWAGDPGGRGRYTNCLLVWGAMHQWGFAWQDGTLTGRRWRPAAMAAGGAALLAGLLTWGPFPVDMIGARERIGNTTPPSIALLAFARSPGRAAAGLGARRVPAAYPAPPGAARQEPERHGHDALPVAHGTGDRHRRSVLPDGRDAAACHRDGAMVGTAAAWLALLTTVLVPLVMAVMRAQRPMLRLPAGLGPRGSCRRCSCCSVSPPPWPAWPDS